MPHGELDPAVGKLPPIFDDRHALPLRKLIEDFAGLSTSRINREPEYLRLSNPGHSVGQILGANQHVTSLSSFYRTSS
jgi:hypothetical protein